MISEDVKRYIEIIERSPDDKFWKSRLAASEQAISNLSRELRGEQAIKEALLIVLKRQGDLPDSYSAIYLGDD